MIACEIYSLVSSVEPNRIRYIGQTTKPLEKRLCGHISKSKIANYPVSCWIRKNIKSGNTILIKGLCKGEWNKTEQQVLDECTFHTKDLLNCTEGGGGAIGHTWKLGKTARKNISKGHLGLRLSDLHKNAISKGNKGKKRNQEYVDKVTARMKKVGPPKGGLQKGDTHSLDARKKISEAHKGKPKSADHKEKLRQAALKRWSKNKAVA